MSSIPDALNADHLRTADIALAILLGKPSVSIAVQEVGSEIADRGDEQI